MTIEFLGLTDVDIKNILLRKNTVKWFECDGIFSVCGFKEMIYGKNLLTVRNKFCRVALPITQPSGFIT
mgnify:CR=1 FL=1|jgi:hypothetical protein